MSQYLVLIDYTGTQQKLRAGDIIDSRTNDIAELQRSGAAVVPFLPSMAPAIAQYQEQRDNGRRDTIPQGGLAELLLASPAGASSVYTTSGLTVEEAIAAATASGAAASTSLVYRPGYVGLDPSVYSSWAALYADFLLIDGPVSIEVDAALVSPAVIPAGTYALREDTRIFGARLGTTLQVADGATLGNLGQSGPNLSITSLSASPVISVAQTRGFISEETIWRSVGGGAIFDIAPLVALDFRLLGGGIDTGTAAVFDIGANGFLTIYGSRGAFVNGNTIAALDPSSAVTLVDADGSSLFTTTQVGTFATPVNESVVQRDKVAWQENRVSGFAVPAVNELTSVTTGAGTVTVVLPLAASVPGGVGIAVRKEDNTTGSVAVVPSGADTIDGKSAYYLALPRATVYFISDTTGQWRIFSQPAQATSLDFILRASGSPPHGNVYDSQAIIAAIYNSMIAIPDDARPVGPVRIIIDGSHSWTTPMGRAPLEIHGLQTGIGKSELAFVAGGWAETGIRKLSGHLRVTTSGGTVGNPATAGILLNTNETFHIGPDVDIALDPIGDGPTLAIAGPASPPIDCHGTLAARAGSKASVLLDCTLGLCSPNFHMHSRAFMGKDAVDVIGPIGNQFLKIHYVDNSAAVELQGGPKATETTANHPRWTVAYPDVTPWPTKPGTMNIIYSEPITMQLNTIEDQGAYVVGIKNAVGTPATVTIDPGAQFFEGAGGTAPIVLPVNGYLQIMFDGFADYWIIAQG